MHTNWHPAAQKVPKAKFTVMANFSAEKKV
jgi:hypothetical protein